jgi:hypothetical protein
MQLATRIEPRSARRTSRLAIQVLKDRQLSAAYAAQNRLLIEFSLRPNPGRMTGFQFVTVEAGIIRPAAVEFDRNDIFDGGTPYVVQNGSAVGTGLHAARSAAFHSVTSCIPTASTK